MSTCTQDHFLSRVKDHELTVLRDDGLYRHLRFRKPGTGIDGFDLVTWPGYLCYCGDMGEYVFQRTDDMLSFFRRGDGGINPDYWSEKVQARDRDGVKEYSAEKFRRVVKKILDEGEDEVDSELREAVASEVLSMADDGMYAAHQAASEFEHGGFRFSDFHEYDLTEFTFRFIFCCYALSWGIALYDRQPRPSRLKIEMCDRVVVTVE